MLNTVARLLISSLGRRRELEGKSHYNLVLLFKITNSVEILGL